MSNPEKVYFKEVTKGDLPVLQDLAKRTFIHTYADQNTEEDMKEYLEKNFSDKHLNSQLSQSNSYFYFLVFQNKPVGYIKLNKGAAQTEQVGKLGKTLELERIYLEVDHKGKGWGKLLINKTIEVAKGLKLEEIWLGVWEKNVKAIEFYKKQGFEAFDTHIFKLGDDNQTDILMKRIVM